MATKLKGKTAGKTRLVKFASYALIKTKLLASEKWFDIESMSNLEIGKSSTSGTKPGRFKVDSTHRRKIDVSFLAG